MDHDFYIVALIHVCYRILIMCCSPIKLNTRRNDHGILGPAMIKLYIDLPLHIDLKILEQKTTNLR